MSVERVERTAVVAKKCVCSAIGGPHHHLTHDTIVPWDVMVGAVRKYANQGDSEALSPVKVDKTLGVLMDIKDILDKLETNSAVPAGRPLRERKALVETMRRLLGSVEAAYREGFWDCMAYYPGGAPEDIVTVKSVVLEAYGDSEARAKEAKALAPLLEVKP